MRVRPLQPRNDVGQFAPGYILWKRLWYDGEARWVYYPEHGDDDLADMRWLADEGHRAVVWIIAFTVIALILFTLGWT